MLRALVVPLSLANAALAAYSFEPLEHLAGIAPYFEPASPPLDPKPPQGCNVTRASYLVRHAAIYANDFDYEEYIEPFTDKLQNASVDWSKAGSLAFLKDWKTPIEEEDLEEVTRVGEEESKKLGGLLRERYSGFRATKKVWTSTAERTVKSAEYLAQGMTNSTNGTEIVQVPESKAEGADSLTPY
jgi:acid phosphatase